jgi:hypothetical protein
MVAIMKSIRQRWLWRRGASHRTSRKRGARGAPHAQPCNPEPPTVLASFEAAKTAADEAKADHSGSWSIFGWIESVEHISTPVAHALLKALTSPEVLSDPVAREAIAPIKVDDRTETDSALALLRALASLPPDRGRAAVLELLTQGSTMEALVGVVWAALEKLVAAAAASGSELHDKFVQDGAFEMSYGGLEMFFGGLEGT